MIKRIVSYALARPLFIVLGALLFVGGGLIAFKNLPVEAFPDISDTQVTVITLYPGRAAEEVEKQVTIPLEVALAGVPNAVRIFSHTQFGLSYIVITFNDKAGDYFARAQVNERLTQAQLPDGVTPQLAAMSSAIGEIYRYRLRGDHLSSQELRTLQDWVVARQLRMVPGVADIVTIGGLVKQYEVRPDAGRMRDYKISLQQFYDALKKSNANAGGGYVEQGRQQFLIRGIGLLRSADDVENIVVAERNNVPILIKSIAQVRVASLPRQGVAGQDGDDDAVTAIVLMRKGENPSDVLKAVKSKIADIEATQLPPGVKVAPFYDRSWLIGKTLRTVFTNLLEGALLVSVVLWLFLANFRAAAIVALVIPLSLLGTFLGLSWVGIPANLLSLGAMDFGIIVDGAVIVIEHIFHNLTHGNAARDEKTRQHDIIHATVEVGRPTLFSMLIIIAAHIPIFTLQRHEGRIFSPMAFSVTSALVTSLIISLTLVPLLAYLFLRGRLPRGDNRLVARTKSLYQPWLERALARPRRVVGIALAALAASLACVPFLGSEFLPELDEGSVWISANFDPSISISESTWIARRMRQAARDVPEVASVVSKLGRPEDGTDPKGANTIELLVDIKPEEQWRRGMNKERIIAAVEESLKAIPGVEPNTSQPIRDNVLESISQIKGQIVVQIFGDDLGVLQKQIERLHATVRSVPGVARAFIDREGQVPQYRITVDRERAARYGLNVDDIGSIIETAVGGKAATQIWEGERRFDVTVRLDESKRDMAQLRSLMISTPNGAYVPLDEVTDFNVGSGQLNIARMNGQRVMSVGIFIRGRDMGSVVADMQERVGQALTLPPGYRVVWTGEFENQERAMGRLAWVVPLSILVIYLLLVDAFGSLKSATLIVANIPFALIGGIFALLATGIPLSVSAAIGFIALFGQAVLNGVVMVSHFNQLRSAGMPLRQVVVEGALGRLRTVLMTALLAMLGLLPMALSHAIGAETQRPLAVVVIGGLVSATLLTLFVLPTLYYWAHGRAGRYRRSATE